MKGAWLAVVSLAFATSGIALSANVLAPAGTTTIALPTDDKTSFKPGPGVEAARRYCLTCHSAAYVATQPTLTSAQWTAEITKMQRAYGAPIPADAVAALGLYLTSEYGKP